MHSDKWTNWTKKNVFIYPINDIDKVTEIIWILLLNKIVYQRLAQLALDTVSDYTYENIIESHVNAIEELNVRKDIWF